jgi:hypothetical protein
MVVPLVWFGIGGVVRLIAPTFRLGITGTIALFLGMALLIGWLFIRKNGRLFTNAETWRLVIYCSALAIILETLVLFAAITFPEEFPGLNVTSDFAGPAILIAAVIDTLAFTLAFKLAVPKYLGKRVPKEDDSAG